MYPIADLVPYELSYTGPKLHKAIIDLRRDKKFTSPVPCFDVGSYRLARDKTHHIMAAVQLGWKAVPIVPVDPPGDVSRVEDNIEEHLKYKGFANLPKATSLADREHSTTDQFGKQHIDLTQLKSALSGEEATNEDDEAQ